MTGRPCDALLCDLDGVLRHWDRTRWPDLEQEFGLQAGALHAAFAPDQMGAVLTGLMTDEEWRAVIATTLAPQCGSAARSAELVERWSQDVGQIDDEVLELLVRAQLTIPVVLVTNATTRLERDLQQLGVADLVPRVVNSARIGSAKPDPAIYRAAAGLAEVPANRCLFVDDTAGHVRGAEAVGMVGLVYRDVAGLREALGPVVG